MEVAAATTNDLGAIWLFQVGTSPILLESLVDSDQSNRVTASLVQNPRIVSQLVFSPRPVFVEGLLDEAALTRSLQRTKEPAVVAQTDFIDCKGSGSVALWFTIAKKAGVDFRAVGDLDCILDSDVQRFMDGQPEITQRYQRELFIEPASTSQVVRPLHVAMNASGTSTDRKEKAKWLANELEQATGHSARIRKIIDVWRDLGFWIHEQGTLEDVLGIQDKSVVSAVAAANVAGPIDSVSDWAAYVLDPSGDVEELLGVAVESIAHKILEALRLSPLEQFTSPVGSGRESDSRLVVVNPIGTSGRHRLTVREPVEFEGYWLEFDRNTPSNELNLTPPG